MLKLITSNRYEYLEQTLVDALANDEISVFTPQSLIIPSTAVKRSIELRAARQHGVCANIQFDYLGQWLWRQFAKVIEVEEHSPFSPDLLTWRIFASFSDQAFTKEHPRLERYLDGAQSLMRFELAKRCASLFDQYLTYRADWLEAWLRLYDQADEDERWQAALWRRVAAEVGVQTQHPSFRFFHTLHLEGLHAVNRLGLNHTLRVFCLPSMPRLYLDMLKKLSSWIDVDIYAINPCSEYWYEIINPKRLSKLQVHDRAQYHEVGNPLLASWGQQAKTYLGTLIDHELEMIDESHFECPSEASATHSRATSLLNSLQTAMLRMQDLEPGTFHLSPNDRSLEIHVCHSLTRELEVLRDQLLGMFAANNAPMACDILVVTPDLELAAPLIESIFGSTEDDCVIPYIIMGRPLKETNQYAKTLLSVFNFAVSRFEASKLIGLLQLPLIAKQFGINEEDLLRIQAWIDKAGIRWGIDGRHRQQLGLPPTDIYSVVNGLERLYLGYAMPARFARPIHGMLPAGNPEGIEAQSLGRFQYFIDCLQALHEELIKPKLPDDWFKCCMDTLEAFTPIDFTSQDDYQATLRSIRKLHQDLQATEFKQAIAVEVFLQALEASFDQPLQGAVPAGSLCFASMHSMRVLPYRIICVVGLGDDVFPSKQSPLEFDLMARRPRPGDRQRRLDDRALFLDLLLAARERFYISYTGRNIRDNSYVAGSMLISELLDAAALLFAPMPTSNEALEAAKRQIVIEHPLQAFSLDYFQKAVDPRLHNYRRSLRNAQAESLKRASKGNRSQGFFFEKLSMPSAHFYRLRIESLIEFFHNPSRYLLKHRLGIVLKRSQDGIEDHEPFEAKHRSAQSLASRILDFALAGDSKVLLQACAQAGLEYPPDRLGALAREHELQAIMRFADELKPRLAEPTQAALTHRISLDLDGEPWELSYTLSDLRTGGLCRYRYADANCYDYLRVWIEHLALQSLALASQTGSHAFKANSYWQFRDRCLELPPIVDAQEQLILLLKRYRDGLSAPLRFFPKSAWAYISKGRTLAAASEAWYSSDYNAFGEGDDPAYQLALRDLDDPFDDEFEHHAEAVFGRLHDTLGACEP
ncbi:MAG: exodeoxyribonuclease V subunit gamma [Burkholderiaceae bacterium]